MRTIAKTSLLTVIFLVASAMCGAQNQPQVERITNGPVVKGASGSAAEIAWSTDAPGSSVVMYGSSPAHLNQTAQQPWGGKKEPNGDYNHSVWVKGLQPNTTYYFVVVTGQGAGTGTATQSRPQAFQTTAQ